MLIFCPKYKWEMSAAAAGDYYYAFIFVVANSKTHLAFSFHYYY